MKKNTANNFITKKDLEKNGYEVVELVKDFVQVISDELKAGYASLAEKQDDFEVKVDSLSVKVDSFAEKVDSLSVKVDSFAEKQDEILDAVTKLGEDNVVVKGHRQMLRNHEERILRLENCATA